MKTSRKSAVQAAADQTELARLRARLLELTSKCPPAVLTGSHQQAVKWKDAASKARRLAERGNAGLQQMRNAEANLAPFYAREV